MPALVVYMLFGLALAWRLLPSHRGAVKCWLGLVFGCAALMWLPCLIAFFAGFTMTAQLVALCLATVGTVCLLLIGKDYKLPRPAEGGHLPSLPAMPAPPLEDMAGALASLLLTAFCGYLLYTHVLLPHADGSLWVGQSTYGDLGMHLGFAESLYRQGDFPPDYSIFPGQRIDYPFLVDAATASLRFFGLSLRMAVILPSLVMLFAVFYGFWLLAAELTKKLAPTLLSWLLFVFNGGFGFALFFNGRYTFTDLLTGFYVTPTNLVDEDLRWVNVICDMLIPQRTTMAGWCVVLAAIYLLLQGIRKTLDGAGGRREILVLAGLAGLMPMIHTHSFLALGMLSAGWFFAFLLKARKAGRLKALILNYVLYGGVCLAIALPQLIVWTFDAASTGNLLWLNPGWVHGEMNWLWFWMVNCGVVFCVMLAAMFFLRGDDARVFWGAAPLFILANLVAFQPNPYDDNKLLYVWYMVTDIVVCGWLWEQMEKIRPRALARGAAAVLVVCGTLSGCMSLLREAVSEYQLLSGEQAAAADYIIENTPADSLFLTTSDHTNPVSVLTGRNILCGAGMYLYYHGIDYGEREALLPLMYAGGEDFERYAQEYGVDYVYIGGSEYAEYPVNYGYFAENYPLVYDQGGVSIFQIT